MGVIEELNLFQICEMLDPYTSVYHVIALSMHGSLFAPCNLFFFFFADLRPEPAIITTQYASILVQVLTCHQQQSQDHRLGKIKIPFTFISFY